MTQTQHTEIIDFPALNADDTALAHWLAEKIIDARVLCDSLAILRGDEPDAWSSADDWDAVAEIGFQCIPVVIACTYSGYRFLRDYVPANWAGVKVFAHLFAQDLPA